MDHDGKLPIKPDKCQAVVIRSGMPDPCGCQEFDVVQATDGRTIGHVCTWMGHIIPLQEKQKPKRCPGCSSSNPDKHATGCPKVHKLADAHFEMAVAWAEEQTDESCEQVAAWMEFLTENGIADFGGALSEAERRLAPCAI